MTAKIPFHVLKAGEQQTEQTTGVLRRYEAGFCLNESTPQHHSIYPIEESSLRPPMEKRSHWSIAWSDLMMTMFILFLSLFVYQAAHKDFLISDKSEVLAGDTQQAIEVKNNGKASLPFAVITPGPPLITAGTVRKIEPITLQEVDLESTFSEIDANKTLAELAKEVAAPAKSTSTSPPPAVEPPAPPVETALVTPDETIIQPLPLEFSPKKKTSVNELFSQSKRTLDAFHLNEFATIDLLPDKAVHIVLTGDLLFETGHAALSEKAIHSLEKIAAVIRKTPHRIHIEGHTDNVPIFSDRYANNWELSIARANAVANFLIKDMGMDPKQFVVSGYASYKPVEPNNSAKNRAANRRVEIVIAQPQQQQIAFSDSLSSPYQKL